MIIHPGISKAVYALFGAGGFLIGLVALVRPSTVVDITASADQLHLVQELGCAAVLVGLLALSCIRERGRTGHYLLMVFFGLLALLHWVAFWQGDRPLLSPVLNTVPIGVLTGLLLLTGSDP